MRDRFVNRIVREEIESLVGKQERQARDGETR
jgi:hypothetical protein